MVIITGKGGKQWKIDKNGKPEYLGETGAEGGVPDKKNTNGMSGSGKVNRISSKDVSVVFNASGYYATDQLRTNISDNRFTKQYETLPSESGDYRVLYKMVSDAPDEKDIITAKVKLSKGRTTDDIIFKTTQGTKVKVTGWDGNTATLELKREFDFVKTEILATVKPKDSTQNYDIAGKANLWQVKSRKVNLTIVPVGGSIDETNLEKNIKDIYNKVGVDFNITIDEPFEIGRDKWDINGNKKLDIGDSNTLANYTPEQRKIYNYYQQQRAPQQQRYYIFVLGNNIKTTDPDTQGFMPLKRQYGFVYNPKNLARTIAHELGHGVFGLEHPFKQYDITQGKTDLLMDYRGGTALTQMDWQKIHAPGVQLYIFQKDEDGEAAVVAYETDGHYSTVYLVCLMLGLDEERAKKLAHWTEYPDTDIHDGLAELRYTWADGEEQVRTHALNNGYHSTIEFLTAFEFMNAKTTDLKELGRILHKYGDTYAHSRLENFDDMGNAIKHIDSIKMYGEPSRLNYQKYGGSFLSWFFDQKNPLVTVDHFFSDGTKPDMIAERPNWYVKYVENLAMLISLKFDLKKSLHKEFQNSGIKLFKELANYAKQNNISLIGIINYEIAKWLYLNKQKPFSFFLPYADGKGLVKDEDAHYDHIKNTEKYLKKRKIKYHLEKIQQEYFDSPPKYRGVIFIILK